MAASKPAWHLNHSYPPDQQPAPYARHLPPRPSMTRFMDAAPAWLADAFDAASKWVGVVWSSHGSDEPEWDHDPDGRRKIAGLRGAEAIGSMIEPGRPAETIVRKVRQDGTPVLVDKSFEVQARDSRHIVMIDIDMDAVLIPSSTPGHHHLIIDQVVDWSDYVNLLKALAACQIVEDGYVNASIRREETFLRLPWVRKWNEREDAGRALDEWLDADTRPEELQTPDAMEKWLTEESA